MAVQRWWASDAGERFWLEATDREDIGADLRAPLADAAGRENWRYTLFREALPGDIVFHYDGRLANAIVGWSQIAGPPQSRSLVWKARGTYARERGAVPEQLPGYSVPLSEYRRLPEPLTLEQLRAEHSNIAQLVAGLEESGKRPLYFPFEISDRRAIRPMQGYAFKLPADFVMAFPQLRVAIASSDLSAAEKVRSVRNPPWSRDELILALDLYLTEFEPPLRQQSREVRQLSELLGQMAGLLGSSTSSDHRNANGVYMKLMNFRRLDPKYAAVGKTGLARGNRDEVTVWHEFANDRARLRATAAAIRAAILSSDDSILAQTDDELEEAPEGRVLTRLHRSRERNRELVATRKARAERVTGRLCCEVCGFDFLERYGERGRGFIEAHHTRPVHTLQPGETTRLTDLALVCANCHRMIHARRPWLSLADLHALLT